MAENEPTTQNSEPKPLRTFQSDVEEALKGGDGSLATIAIAEEKKRVATGVFVSTTEAPQRSNAVLLISIALVAIGLIVLVTLYLLRPKEVVIVPSNAAKQLIAADSQKVINVAGLAREGVIAALTKERNTYQGTLSTILAIQLTKTSGENPTLISTADFLTLLKTKVPAELVRSLGETFMFGLHSFAKNQPFLILKTNYYQNAFAGMLTWEKTLSEDIGPLLRTPQTALVATTTETVLATQKPFQDIIVKNRDARALKDENGAVILLYSFPDKSTIIITTSTDTLEAVSERLLATKLVQ